MTNIYDFQHGLKDHSRDYVIDVNNTLVDGEIPKKGSVDYVTGWLEGGQATINSSDDTLVDITAGSAMIIDGSSNSAYPTATLIEWDDQVGVSTNLGTNRTKWLGVQDDGDGTVTFVTDVRFDSLDRRSTAILCRIRSNTVDGHITNIDDYERPAWGLRTALQDFLLETGSFNISGNEVSANGDNLLLDKSAGRMFRYHGADTYGYENVHEEQEVIGRTTYAYHVSGSNTTSSLSSIDPNFYDLLQVKTAVPNNKFTNQRVYYFPVSGTWHVVYGQQIYDKLSDARAGTSSESVALNQEILNGSVLIAVISVKAGTISLANTQDAWISKPSDIGIGSGGDASSKYETNLYVHNNTGATLTRGQVVLINGASSGLPTVTLAKADTEETSAGTIGVVKNDIPHNSDGDIIIIGTCSEFNTTGGPVSETWNNGDTVYLSPAASGSMTNILPTAPDHLVVIGWITNTNANTGSMVVRVQNGWEIKELHDAYYDEGVISDGDIMVWNEANSRFEASENINNRAINLSQETNEHTGFPNITDSTMSFDDGTRTFTISPSGSSFHYYVKDDKFEKISPENVVIPDSEGMHFMYYDANGDLNTTQASTTDLITQHAFVCLVYWDSTNKKSIFLADERHGITMDSATHLNWHERMGTTYLNGFDLGDIVSDGSGNSDSSAQLSISGGGLLDEDIHFTLSALSAPANIPIYYKDGASGSWRRKTPDNFPIIHSGTAGYTGAGGRVAYNQWTGSEWTLTEVTNNDFVLVHYFATNSYESANEFIGIQGEVEYGTAGAAREGAAIEINSLFTGGIPTKEFVPIATVIYQTSSSYSNAPQARIISVDTGIDFIDWRSSSFKPGGGSTSITEHGNLSGLSEDDHSIYMLLSSDRGSQTVSSDVNFTGTSDVNGDGIAVHNILQVYDSTGDIIITPSGTTSGDAFPFDAELIKDSKYTHSTSTNPEKIYVNASGLYKISYCMSFFDNVARASAGCSVRKNGVQIPMSESYGYSRDADAIIRQTCTVSTYSEFNINDYLELFAWQVDDDPTHNMKSIADECWISVEFIR